MVIYLTINKINGKKYLGKDVRNNPKYLGSGFDLKKAIEKYGVSPVHRRSFANIAALL